jgi:uncharacterized protein (TIGR02301 family)
MHAMTLRALILAAMLVTPAAPALAQDPGAAGVPQREAPLGMVAELAEVLGRAHAIRTLCNGDQDSTWRNYMLNLMAYEGGGGRRATLTDAFNRGYRGQNRDTGACTASMTALEAGIARRGRELSDAIALSYLN